MRKLSTEQILPAGTDMYHHTRDLEGLLSSSFFDTTRSNNDGAIYLTPERTTRSNCIATATSDLRLFDLTTLPDKEIDDLKDTGSGDFWEGAAQSGYDGRLFCSPDVFCITAMNTYVPEIVIFRYSLQKLGNIRSI